MDHQDLLAELRPLTRKDRSRAGGLTSCTKLRDWVLTRLGEARAPDREFQLRRVFDLVVADAYQALQDRGYRQRDRHDRSCLVVAAAELLGMENRSSFDLLLAGDEQARADYEKRGGGRRGSEGLRNARVAIWLGNSSASSGYNDKTRSDCLAALLSAVESSLGDPSFRAAILPGRDLSPVPAGAAKWPDWYIRRPRLEEEVRRLVEDRAVRVVALVGGAGMGKSSLALGVAHHLIGDGQVPVIRFTDGRPALRDLAPLLDRCGYDANVLTETNAGYLLSRLVSGQTAPRLVILDNLSTTTELDATLPYQPVSTVVVTARTQDHRDGTGIASVAVGEMLREEALALAEHLCPGLTDGDRAVIVTTMGDHPLAISFACGLISETKADVSALCDQVRASAGNITTEHGEQLDVLTDRLLTELGVDAEGGFTVEPVALACIVATSQRPESLSVLTDGYLGYTDAGVRALCRMADSDEGEELHYAMVIRNLKALNILRESRSKISFAVFIRIDEKDPEKAEMLRARRLAKIKEDAKKHGMAAADLTYFEVHPLVAETLSRLFRGKHSNRVALALLALGYKALEAHRKIPRSDEERWRSSSRDLAFYLVLLQAWGDAFPPLPDSTAPPEDPENPWASMLDEIFEVVAEYSPSLVGAPAPSAVRPRLLREGLSPGSALP